MTTWSIRARWLFPVGQPPIRDGVLTITDDRISAVEPWSGQKVDHDAGNAAIIPGLVNAHCHLDLGGLRGRIPPTSDFAAWLREVVQYRRESNPQEWLHAVRRGIHQSLTSGTTLTGDVASAGLSAVTLQASPLRSVVFFELLGLTATRREQIASDATAWFTAQPPASLHYVPALGPHAPYSTHQDLVTLGVALARQRNAPLMVHFAETRHEAELLATRAGSLRGFLEDLGAWDPSGLARNLDEVAEWLDETPRLLYVHGNYLLTDAGSQRALEQLRRGQASLVYCPRTHHYFGHDPHPFLTLHRQGVNVAIGTDSLASNPDLSLLNELKWLWQRHRDELSGPELLAMGTFNGARALGFEDLGKLTPNFHADFVAVQLPDREDEPHALLFDPTAQVVATWIAGGVVEGTRSTLRALLG